MTVTLRSAPVRRVQAAEAQLAVEVVVRAFAADPAARWIYPEPERYFASFPLFVRAFAGRAFEHGTAYTADAFRGAALWLPPGIGPDEAALDALLEKTAAPHRHDAAFALFEQMGEHHPHEPHWYLPLIGVDPLYQGKGYGAALMEHALAACDRDGLPAYLESSNPRNVTLYERCGFQRLGTIQAGDSPPIIPMLRPARG